MLAVVAGLVVVAAGAGYFWMTRGKSAPAITAPTTVAPSAISVTARPGPRAAAAATPRPVVVASAPPATAAPAPILPATPPPTLAPKPVPTPAATAVAVRPTPTPYTPPVSMARALPPPVTATPPPVVVPPPPTTTATTVGAAPPPTLAREAAVLSTVSPPSVKRPGRVLLDLRGAALRPDLRVRILPLKESTRGITVVRQVCKSPNLFQVLIDLDAQVTPGAYAIALADSIEQTATLTLTVTK